METDVAGFDHEHKGGGSQQPKCGGDGMYVDDRGYRRLLLEVGDRGGLGGHDTLVWTPNLRH
jgi:hypothetical protein